MVRETRLNNGFSVQVSSDQQEALNLIFSASPGEKEKFDHPAEEKNKPLLLKEGTCPRFEGHTLSWMVSGSQWDGLLTSPLCTWEGYE